MGVVASWTFSVDEYDSVIPGRDPVSSENLRNAVEVFIDPFGMSAESVSIFEREWRLMHDRYAVDYVLGTDAAAVRRVDEESVRIEDILGQFDDCLMDSKEFEGLIAGLIEFLRNINDADGDSGR